MAETVVAPTYGRCCMVGPAGTTGGLRETVRLMNDDNSMRRMTKRTTAGRFWRGRQAGIASTSAPSRVTAT